MTGSKSPWHGRRSHPFVDPFASPFYTRTRNILFTSTRLWRALAVGSRNNIEANSRRARPGLGASIDVTT